MKRDKLISKIDGTLDEYYQNGYSDGFDTGWSDGYDEGVLAHKNMMIERLTLHLEGCMTLNRMSEAKFTKQMLEYLTWDYDPEKAAKDLAQDEETYGLIL